MFDDEINLDRFAFKCLVKAVCEYFKIQPEQLLGKSRINEFVKPRHILFYMGYIYTGYSLPQIARKCDRDHTTVLYAYKKIAAERMVKEDVNLAISQIHLIAVVEEKKRMRGIKQQRIEVQKMIDSIGGKHGLRTT